MGGMRVVYNSQSMDTSNKSVDLLSAPSSLKLLELDTDKLQLHALHFKDNTNLTALKLYSLSMESDHNLAALISIVSRNKTLEKLFLGYGFHVENIDALSRLVCARREKPYLTENWTANLW